MKEIFVSKNKSNVILEGKVYHYLIVSGVRKNEDSKFICAFEGELRRKRDGKWYTVAELLAEYIKNTKEHGEFYLDHYTTPRSKNRRIEEVLYSLYYQEDLSIIKDFNIKIANRGRMSFVGDISAADAEELELIKYNDVCDLSENNIRSNDKGSHAHTSGTVFVGDGCIGVTCDKKFFYTDYDEGLLKLLRCIRCWRVQNGALKACLTKNVQMQFATIVWMYYHNEIPAGVDKQEWICRMYELYTSKGFEVDHLTENRTNNFIRSLVLVHGSTNKASGNRRSGFKKPYYFYCAYNREARKLLVKCGFDNDRRCYERLYSFDMLSYGWEAEYRSCLDAFVEKARGAGCWKKTPSEDNPLCYWADPCRAKDEDNPLNKLLTEPLENFKKYHDGAFDDMDA